MYKAAIESLQHRTHLELLKPNESKLIERIFTGVYAREMCGECVSDLCICDKNHCIGKCSHTMKPERKLLHRLIEGEPVNFL